MKHSSFLLRGVEPNKTTLCCCFCCRHRLVQWPLCGRWVSPATAVLSSVCCHPWKLEQHTVRGIHLHVQFVHHRVSRFHLSPSDLYSPSSWKEYRSKMRLFCYCIREQAGILLHLLSQVFSVSDSAPNGCLCLFTQEVSHI